MTKKLLLLLSGWTHLKGEVCKGEVVAGGRTCHRASGLVQRMLSDAAGCSGGASRQVFTLRDRRCRLRSGRQSGDIITGVLFPTSASILFRRLKVKFIPASTQITGKRQTLCTKCLQWQTKIDPGGWGMGVIRSSLWCRCARASARFFFACGLPAPCSRHQWKFTRPPAVSSPAPGTGRTAHSRTLCACRSPHP